MHGYCQLITEPLHV